MRLGKGKISGRGYFFLLTSSFNQYNWLFSPPSLISQVKIARRWELWRWGGGEHPDLDILFKPTKYVDGQIAILRCCFFSSFFLFFFFFFILFQSYQDDGKEII